MANNHDWLSLVNLSGLLVSEPVLNDAFPDGPPALENWQARRFRTEYERWLATQDRGRWTNFILTTILGYDYEHLRAGMSLPLDVRIELTDTMQKLSPDRVLMGADGDKALLVYFADGELDRPEQVTGRWKASPFTKLDRLLRETRVPLGLLTNGDDWRLVYAAPGLTTSSITWNAATWLDEVLTLRAFRMLLGDPVQLQQMASDSQQRQADVTDQLGNQVLRALAILIHELDTFDAASEDALLAGMSPEDVYKMALFVMMRLVFILFAEENSLLPHGDVFYDRGYGLTYLWNRLEHERREDPERFSEKLDAWPSLLAAFNLIYDGSPHPDFVMPAYGGSLFDPAQFPALLSPDLRISNQSVWRMLRHLTTAESRDGRQRVSYRMLAPEQLGYVYEGLLGYTVKVAKEWMIDPEGGLEPLPFSHYQNALPAGELYEFLRSITDVHWSRVREWANEIEERAASGSEDERWIWEPVVEMWIAPERRYLAPEMGTRKRGGIFYTPPQLTSFLVEQALEPQCYADATIRPARDLLALTICDPAMGSGAFLVQAVRYLADCLLKAWDAATADADGAKLVMPYAERPGHAREDYGPIPTDRAEALIWARRLVAERCIYGVDLNALAVELAKLSIWLVTLSQDKPFTFLDHRLRHGNSLIGASFLQETEIEIKKGRVTTRGTVRQIAFIPDAALAARKDADKAEKAAARERIKVNQNARQKIAAGELYMFADMSVEQALAALADRERDLAAPTLRPADYRSKQHLLAQVLYQGDYPRLKEIADLWCAVWFWPRDLDRHGPPPTTQEYHDAMYTILGLPAIITTSDPRLDRIRTAAREVAAREHFFHWELEFPAIFTRPNPGFDAMCGNPPWEIVKPNSQEFFETYDPNFRRYAKQEAIDIATELFEADPSIESAWKAYETSQERQAAFVSSGIIYEFQGRGDINTYKLFAERLFGLIRSHGFLGVVLPSGIYMDLGTKEIRQMLLDQGHIQYLFSFSNEKFFFPNVHHSFKFTMLGAQKGMFGNHFPAVFLFDPRVAIAPSEMNNVLDEAENLVYIPRDSIARFSPDSLSIMEFSNQRDVQLASKIYNAHPFLGEENQQGWNIRLAREFDMTNDSDLFQTDLTQLEDLFPVYEGRMIDQYDHRKAYWVKGRGRTAIWEYSTSPDRFAADYPWRAQYYIDHQVAIRRQQELYGGPIWRIGICDVTSSVTVRSVLAAILPKEVGVGNSVNTVVVVSPEGKAELNALVYLLTILNSFVFDYIMRFKIKLHLNQFILSQGPVPRLQSGNRFFDALVPRAARLTCTTPHFADLWQSVMGTPWEPPSGVTDPAARQRLRDEIDALVAHLYGLSRDDFAHILGTFPLVFPPVAKVDQWTLDQDAIASDDAGTMNPKLYTLLKVYDEFAAIVEEWDRK
jgi:hypothetical protein